MATFRDMIAGDTPVATPVVFNPIMAKLAEQAGFKALYLGGGTMGYVKTVLEANLTLTEMAQIGTEIRSVCQLPLVLDAATGWGDPMHMRRLIAMTEAAGFAAIEIEDQIIPKRAHHHIGIEHMIPADLMVEKIKEAIAARTSGIRSTDMDDALKRAEAYRAAGADVIMLSPRNPEEYAFVAERLAAPLMFNLPAGGLSKYGLTLQDMAAFNCRILVDPSNPFIAAYKAWRDCYRAMADGMVSPGFSAEEGTAIQNEMFETIGLESLLEVERRTVEGK
jgi:methylisocitrate lyase